MLFYFPVATPEYGPPPSREHTRVSLFSANCGGWVAHVSTTRHSITYLGSTQVDPTMRKESYCKWASPFVAKAASKYFMQSGFKVRSRHFWPYPTSQHQRCPQKKNKMSTWKWHPNARCPTHRVKVVRYAAMQFMNLSRDIQKHVVISLKSKIITLHRKLVCTGTLYDPNVWCSSAGSSASSCRTPTGSNITGYAHQHCNTNTTWLHLLS